MPRLVAVQRADKNGKLVTRHIKEEASSSGRSIGIPSPTLKLSHYEKTHNLEVLERALQYGQIRPNLDKHLKKLLSPEEVIESLDVLDKYRNSDNAASLRRHMILLAENQKYGKGLYMSIVRNYEQTHGMFGGGSYADIILGIEAYDKEVTDDQRLALIEVTYAATHVSSISVASDEDEVIKMSKFDFPITAYELTNRELVDFVIENVHLSTEIAKIVRERKTDDVALIKEVLDNPTQSLMSGVL